MAAAAEYPRRMTEKAPLEQTNEGLSPTGAGWFIANAADLGWATLSGGGTWCSFESPSSPSPLLGIVEGEEHRLRAWDYLHCPPGTAHITVGAGEEPCALLMVGTRSPDATIRYLVEPAAAKHGASVETASDSPREVYADLTPIVPASSPWPLKRPAESGE